MSKNRTIELANVVVNIGDKGLVENLKDRVLPGIKDQSIKGRGEVHEYRFLGVKVGQITENQVPVLFGRLVKIMTIEAEQELDESGDELINSSKQIPSAPSSFFVINLVDHRMAYLGETRRSPGLRDFESCIRRLLDKDWKQRIGEHLQALLAAENRERTPRGKTEEYYRRVLAEVPQPTVRVTPLPALSEIDKKLEAFAKLEAISVKPMKTNNEMPDENAEFLRKYKEQQVKLGSTSSKFEMKNGKDGLQKEEAQKLIKAASDGNFQVTMKGSARNGNQISGDLDELSIKLKEQIPDQESDADRASRLLNKMKEAFQAGYVIAGATANELLERAKAIVQSINGGE